jgi:hypothetical protein
MKLNLKTFALFFVSSLLLGFVTSCDDDDDDPILATLWYFGGEVPTVDTGNDHLDQIIESDLVIDASKKYSLLLSDVELTIKGKGGYYSCTFYDYRTKDSIISIGYYSISGNQITVYRDEDFETNPETLRDDYSMFDIVKVTTDRVNSNDEWTVLKYTMNAVENEITGQRDDKEAVQNAVAFDIFDGVPYDTEVNSAITTVSWIRKEN